jgi:hypothetical protein
MSISELEGHFSIGEQRPVLPPPIKKLTEVGKVAKVAKVVKVTKVVEWWKMRKLRKLSH